MRTVLVCLVALLAFTVSANASAAPPPIKHVFVITLENKGYDETFGPASPAPYLSRDLPAQGQLLTQYYGIGHASLDNYIAMVSGQAPNVVTQADCPFYFNFVPGIAAPSDGQVIGQGCVYPSQVKTVANQLESAGLTWKGYMEDMGSACRHPALNSRDDTQQARPGDQYAARHNPFVYFHSIIDSPSCAQNDVPLDRLDSDLASASTTPSYAFITPNLCHDGHDQPCVNGEPGGLVSADQFLQTWVPKIMGSPAWGEGSLLVVTFDEAENGDASACCGEKPGFNTPNPGGPTPGPGGGRTGAVLVSQFIQPGTTNATPYNHYSLLKSTEDVFALPYLGYAGQAGLAAFGGDVYGAP
jgi:phosphatidylinositol-3-phosphatase